MDNPNNKLDEFYARHFPQGREEILRTLIGWEPACIPLIGNPAHETLRPVKANRLTLPEIWRTAPVPSRSGMEELRIMERLTSENACEISCLIMSNSHVERDSHDGPFPDKILKIRIHVEKGRPNLDLQYVYVRKMHGFKFRGYGKRMAAAAFQLGLALGCEGVRIIDMREDGPPLWLRLHLKNVAWPDSLSSRLAKVLAVQPCRFRENEQRMIELAAGAKDTAIFPWLATHRLRRDMLANIEFGGGFLDFSSPASQQALHLCYGVEVGVPQIFTQRPPPRALSGGAPPPAL